MDKEAMAQRIMSEQIQTDYVEALRAWCKTPSRELPIEEICETLEAYDQLKKEVENLNKALALKLDALPSGLSAGQSIKLEQELAVWLAEGKVGE